MKVYESIQSWKEDIKFTEMSRIGNLPKHSKISVWINEGGEEREEPHFHVILSNKSVLRIKIKTLEGMDNKNLNSDIKKEFKKWLLSPHKENNKIKNIEFAIMVWNAQEHYTKIKESDLTWI